MLAQGKRKFDCSDRDENDRSPKKREAEGKKSVIINTIFGGPSRGHSCNKRKALIREVKHEVNTSYVWAAAAITFFPEDLDGVRSPQNYALVISLAIDNVRVRRVLIDGGVSTNILTISTYLVLGWEMSQLKWCPTPLASFSGEFVVAEGCTDFPVTIGEGKDKVRKVTEFVVVNGASAYNAILDRPYIHKL